MLIKHTEVQSCAAAAWTTRLTHVVNHLSGDIDDDLRQPFSSHRVEVTPSKRVHLPAAEVLLNWWNECVVVFLRRNL